MHDVPNHFSHETQLVVAFERCSSQSEAAIARQGGKKQLIPLQTRSAVRASNKRKEYMGKFYGERKSKSVYGGFAPEKVEAEVAPVFESEIVEKEVQVMF